jgi:hypothetical protein
MENLADLGILLAGLGILLAGIAFCYWGSLYEKKIKLQEQKKEK